MLLLLVVVVVGVGVLPWLGDVAAQITKSSSSDITYKSTEKKRTGTVIVFRDEDTEWLFELQLVKFESSDDESCGDVFSSDNEEF